MLLIKFDFTNHVFGRMLSLMEIKKMFEDGR